MSSVPEPPTVIDHLSDDELRALADLDGLREAQRALQRRERNRGGV